MPASDEEVAGLVARLDRLDEDIAALRITRDEVEQALAEAVGFDGRVIEGVGSIARHRRTSRTKWDSQNLLMRVRDSRIVDEESGEVLTGAALLEKVYALTGANARVTALRECGIEPDEYCHTEHRGYRIKIER